MHSILTRDLAKTYWFYEKEAGLMGSMKALFRGRKVFVEAVRGIDLDVEVGEMVGFIGPNGAGKTTTLKMLAGVLHPTGGRLEVMGFNPAKREKNLLKNIAFVSGQRSRLFWDLPAQEYFNFCKVIYEIPRDIYQNNLDRLVEMSQIGDILKIPQRKLSFGQRKRCELVAALLHDPKLVFLDEPTNALDLVNAGKVREFIKEKGREGSHTIVLTSHNMSDIEQVCDRVVIINQGKIVFDGDIPTLTRLDGLRKQVKVVFNGPWDKSLLKTFCEITQQLNGQEVCLEVEPDQTATLASQLFKHFPVKDIKITDPPLEKIVESLYLKNGR